MKLSKEEIIFKQRFLKSQGLYKGKIDGIWGPKTNAAVIDFEYKSEIISRGFGTFDDRTEQNIKSLTLRAQVAARKAVKALNDAGINSRIISGTRTYEEQNALYRKGRWGNPGPKVTNSRGGASNHNFGIAWDIGIFSDTGKYITTVPVYNRVSNIVLNKVPNIEWGGTWTKFIDPSHYQLHTGLSIAKIREKFEKGENYTL